MDIFFNLLPITILAITLWYYFKVYRPSQVKSKNFHKATYPKQAPPKKGGYLGFYGLWDWYNSQSEEVQDYLYKSCGYGINSDSSRLLEGDIEILTTPDDPYQISATRFLCNHALNAVKDKKHAVCQALLEGAFNHAKNPKDSHYYGMISLRLKDDLKIYPDQEEIDLYKVKVLSLIRENPGILQMDIKKHFPAKDESLVGHALSQLKYEEKIRREKKGRSFQLWVVE